MVAQLANEHWQYAKRKPKKKLRPAWRDDYVDTISAKHYLKMPEV